MDYVRACIELNLLHDFVVVRSLVAWVILGVHFLRNNALTLDFTTTLVSIQHAQSPKSSEVTPFFDAVSKSKAKTCAISAIQPSPIDITDECVIPMFGRALNYEFPQCQSSIFNSVVHAYCNLFQTVPGKTKAAEHFILTSGNPNSTSTHSSSVSRRSRETNTRNARSRNHY